MTAKGGTVTNALKGSTEIELLVNNEKDLYTPFSPDAEFSMMVKSYIKSKAARADFNSNINLRVICPAPIDEERFLKAVSNWIQEEKSIARQESKIMTRTLIGMLVIASLFIILSISLADHFSVFSYTIIPVLGSVALGRTAGIFLTDVPIDRAKQTLFSEWEKNRSVIFEYPESE